MANKNYSPDFEFIKSELKELRGETRECRALLNGHLEAHQMLQQRWIKFYLPAGMTVASVLIPKAWDLVARFLLK